MIIDEEIPEEMILNEQISVAPSIYTHSSVIVEMQNRIIEQNCIIQNDPQIKKQATENDLFKEDLDISQFDPYDSKYKSKPHEVHFRVDKFFKYLFFSITFNILGPFAILIFIWKHQQLLRNFIVLGWKWSVLMNYTRYSVDFLIVIGFIFNQFDSFSYYIALYFGVQFLSEAIIQQIVLAFYHPQKLDLLESFPLEKIINQFENQINPKIWTLQPAYLIEFELQQSMKRLHIEPGQFIFFFIVQPNEKRRDKIKHEFENLKSDKYAGDGLKMAVEIIEYFNEKSSMVIYIIIGILLTAIRLAAHLYFSHFWEQPTQKIIQFCTIVALNSAGYLFIVLLMLTTFRDLQRKVFSLNQLSHLISAQQVEEFDETKIFPTLNFLCVQSLFSWQNLRRVLLDYGLQYSQRQNAIISFMLEVVLVLVGASILLFFFPIDSMSCDFLYPLIALDVLTIIFLAIMIVLQGARINKHFKIHQTMLKKNMFIYQQLSTQSFIKKEYHVQPQDFMFRTLKNIIDKIQITGDANWFFLYSQYVINAINQAYVDLCYEEENQPFTVLGIAMTNSLALQLIVSFLGILGTVLGGLYFQIDF